jgi:hypothetical protein
MRAPGESFRTVRLALDGQLDASIASLSSTCDVERRLEEAGGGRLIRSCFSRPSARAGGSCAPYNPSCKPPLVGASVNSLPDKRVRT